MYDWKIIDEKKAQLDKPFPQNSLKSLQEKIALEWTYHSNAIEGNSKRNKGGFGGDNYWRKKS